MKLFCSRACFGVSRRKNKSAEQRRAEKASYDKALRCSMGDFLRAKKRDKYHRTKDREKERITRQKRMPKHVEYCRRPEYRALKHEYDIKRAGMAYGEYAECWRLLIELTQLIRETMPRYEIYRLNGYYQRQRERKQFNV